MRRGFDQFFEKLLTLGFGFSRLITSLEPLDLRAPFLFPLELKSTFSLSPRGCHDLLHSNIPLSLQFPLEHALLGSGYFTSHSNASHGKNVIGNRQSEEGKENKKGPDPKRPCPLYTKREMQSDFNRLFSGLPLTTCELTRLKRLKCP